MFPPYDLIVSAAHISENSQKITAEYLFDIGVLIPSFYEFRCDIGHVVIWINHVI